MNNYQDEEAGFIKNQYSERVVAWGKFLVFLLLGVIILIVSFPFSSILLINPAPFIMLFSAGSLMILIAILQIAEVGIIIKHTGSLAGTIVYLITLGLGIYAGVFHIGYFNTISVMCIQLLTLGYLMISLLPGGQDGLHTYVKGMFIKSKLTK